MRLSRQTSLVWLVLILFSGGRFLEFFLRSDSPELALGLNNAQWTSLALLVASSVGLGLQGAAISPPRKRVTPN